MNSYKNQRRTYLIVDESGKVIETFRYKLAAKRFIRESKYYNHKLKIVNKNE
jgi:hypothetical protein